MLGWFRAAVRGQDPGDPGMGSFLHVLNVFYSVCAFGCLKHTMKLTFSLGLLKNQKTAIWEYKKAPAGTTMAEKGFKKWKSANLENKKAPAGTTLVEKGLVPTLYHPNTK